MGPVNSSVSNCLPVLASLRVNAVTPRGKLAPSRTEGDRRNPSHCRRPSPVPPLAPPLPERVANQSLTPARKAAARHLALTPHNTTTTPIPLLHNFGPARRQDPTSTTPDLGPASLDLPAQGRHCPTAPLHHARQCCLGPHAPTAAPRSRPYGSGSAARLASRETARASARGPMHWHGPQGCASTPLNIGVTEHGCEVRVEGSSHKAHPDLPVPTMTTP